VAAPICVARIGAAHGVRGAVKLWTFTGRSVRRERIRPADDQGRRAPVRGDACPRGKDHLVATLKGIATREDAERLNGIELYIAREKLPETDDDEYYHADLIGLAGGQRRQRAARPRHRDP
jgi:16S rRNA processing protein RimM